MLAHFFFRYSIFTCLFAVAMTAVRPALAEPETTSGSTAASGITAASGVVEKKAEAAKVKPKPTEHPEDGSDLGTQTIESLAANPVYWMCQHKTAVRTIRIDVADGQCRTGYAKEGQEKNSSLSQQVSTCINVFANIRRNLEQASWKCRNISGATITTGP